VAGDLVNAPTTGDRRALTATEIETCEERAFGLMARCGLHLAPAEPAVVTTPADFHRMFPGTGGALYGPAQHGWRASFSRPTAATRLPGLYLAGGGTHPGAGVPMAALSGQMAAERLVADLTRAGWVSTGRSSRAAMPGGILTP
jgi:1-hydroxycarotenoid 3,4-desaturase